VEYPQQSDLITPEERRQQVWRALLAWYAAEGRAHLPWRETRDPYAILVSEVMLQQTQVERVLPKYREFLARFPTFAALAAEPVGEAIKAWAGLGYNQRAVRLHGITQQVVEEFGGQLPNTLDGLMALKGIGRYTAGAVACFAFGLPVATVDTNIRRVLWRVFRGVEQIPWPGGEAAARMYLELAEWALPRDHAYDWQQALMDLGAQVCLARKPLCERCPLREQCAAYAETAQVALFPSGEALARLRDERSQNEGHLPARRVAESGVPYGAQPSSRRRTVAIPFEQTSRYFRGRIVDALRELPPSATLSLAALGPRIKPDYSDADLPWLRKLAQGLTRDGLARLDDKDETIALP
jgi:A/G-specific adenine glycosylase